MGRKIVPGRRANGADRRAGEDVSERVKAEFESLPTALGQVQEDSDRLTFRNVFVPLVIEAEGHPALTHLALSRLYSLTLSPGRLAARLASLDKGSRQALLVNISRYLQPNLDAIANRIEGAPADFKPNDGRPERIEASAVEAGGRARAFGLEIPRNPRGEVASLQKLDSALSRIYDSSQVDVAIVNALADGLKVDSMSVPVAMLGEHALVDVPEKWWSDVGTMFLDRTRESPRGVAIGEDVYFLPLSPNEEAISEQRAFTKRQIAFEDMTEDEAQKELEFSSTLSTELQDGLERENVKSSSSGFTAGGQIGIGPPVANLGLNVGVSNNTAEADNSTRSHSSKHAFETTTRLAAKYRGLHRITYKLSTESGFESTSKRTQRNPAKFSSNTLAYFKILRKLSLRQERYGVRLCWAPTVQDPGWGLRERIRRGRERIAADIWATVIIPPKPQPPQRADQPAQTVRSLKKITRWDINGGSDITEELSVQAPANLVWDRDAAFVKSSLRFVTSMRRHRVIVPIEEPRLEVDTVKIHVRVMVDPRTILNSLQDPAAEWSEVFVEVSAKFVPNPATGDAAFRQAWDDYIAKLTTWQADLSNLEQRTRARISVASDAWEKELRHATTDLSELTSSLVGNLLPAALRDEPREVDLWRELFEWGSVSYELIPGWWNGAELNDPLEPADSIINASWAKIYLPVNVGAEDLALKWLYGHRLTDKARAKFVKEIQEYRKEHFGEQELDTERDETGDRVVPRSIHLASWDELLPTDGTHIEILRGSTTAAGEWEIAERDATQSRASNVDKLLQSTQRGSTTVNIDVDDSLS